MKASPNLLFISLLLIFIGCKEEFESPKMSVDRYVKLLKAGKYNDMAMPAFSSNDIPELLSFRNENQIIINYPINPLSSSLAQECTLGMYVLWTIESIRAKSLDNAYLMGGFPSQQPMVMKKENFEYIEQNQEIQEEVADSYFDWWESNKNQNFTEFDDSDPLANTEYRWF